MTTNRDPAPPALEKIVVPVGTLEAVAKAIFETPWIGEDGHQYHRIWDHATDMDRTRGLDRARHAIFAMERVRWNALLNTPGDAARKGTA